MILKSLAGGGFRDELVTHFRFGISLTAPSARNTCAPFKRRSSSKTLNRVAIVPTKREAERWEKAGSVVVTARNIDKVLTSLKGTKGSFLALVAKYDGVDLPDDDCRLLVLDSLPRAATLYDRYFQSMMQSTAITNAKIAQKIEQGLGRATRGKSDYCAILITGTDLVSFIKDNHNRRHLSPGTNVQLELGLVIASEIKKSVDPKGFSDALVSEINRCLSRDEEWKSFYRDFLEHARERAAVRPVYEEGLAVAKTEHTAAAVFLKRDYQGAAQQIQSWSTEPRPPNVRRVGSYNSPRPTFT